jgi:hypothetical protein
MGHILGFWRLSFFFLAGPALSHAGKYQLRYLAAVNRGGGGGGGGGEGGAGAIREMHSVQAVSQFEIRNTQEWSHELRS